MSGRPDLDRVRDLLGYIADSARRLRELADLPTDGFLQDRRNPAAAKYLAIVGAASAIDLCNHLVARQGGRAPTDYADCFTVLAELEIVDDDLAGRLRAMARFRNLLVHQYARIDDRRVHETIPGQVTDLEAYASQVRQWLRDEGFVQSD